jgi:hypothetical protein
MTRLREQWQGVSLPGDYLLERWTGGDDTAGHFEASCAADGRRVAVKLMPANTVNAGAQLALWKRTRGLEHRNLRVLLDCGRAELAGDVVIYAVFEHADETLASAIAQSPLSEAEAREVLEAVVGALDYLKSRGLAHRALDPEHVVAVGDHIKLSTDALGEAAGAAIREDLRTFWFRISPCTLARSSDILAQVLGEGRSPAAAADPAVPAETLPRPDVAMPPAAPKDDAPSKGFPKWIPVGAAAVVLLILGLHFRSGSDTPAQVPPAAAVTAPASKAGPAGGAASTPASTTVSAPVSKVTSKGASKPASKQVSAPAQAAAKPSPTGERTWRVIAFAFRTRAAAVRKVEQINQRHPRLEAAVFAPREKQGIYLVALGGRMSHEEALRMEKKARDEYVSRDVYVQHYSE